MNHISIEHELIDKKELKSILRPITIHDKETNTDDIYYAAFESDINELPTIIDKDYIAKFIEFEGKKKKNFNNFAWTLVKDFAGCCHNEADVGVLVQLLKVVNI